MRTFIFILLALFSLSLYSQELPVNPIDYAQNPSDLNWKKIDTEHFEIIFPEELSSEAVRVAHLLEKAYPFVSESLEVYPAKIPLVLQNQSVDSNGFVTLAPRRSEWYVTPSIDPQITNTEWLKTLSIHEFRHVVQFQKTRRGFNKFLEILFGEIGQALGLGLTLPPWFLEGDAVGIETALTKGGRGRIPLFERNLRTLLLEDQKFNYDKAHLGSFKDYIPNHYVYGYFYTSYMRNHFGDKYLSKVSNLSAETSWNPLTFYQAVDELAPTKNFESFYRHVMRDLIASWKERQDKLPVTEIQDYGPKKKMGWTNYLYPQITNDNKILALKNGLSYIDHFVLIDGKKEEVLFYPGILSPEYPYKLRNNRMSYIERDLDPRWGYRDFSRLRVYDLKKRKHILDLRKTKLRLATLNHSGDKIVAIDWSEAQKQSVVILDKKGKKIFSEVFPSAQVITSVDWIDDQNLVFVVKDQSDLKHLVQFNLENKSTVELVAPTVNNFGFVSSENGQIYVESPESGIDNIYQVQAGELKQITVSKYGAYAPTISNNTLIYNDYSVIGMNIVKKTKIYDSEEKSQDSFVSFFEKFAKSEKYTELESEYLKEAKQKIVPYSQFKHAINLHSWTILAPPLSNSLTLIGYSRDILNKFTLSAGVNYNLNEQTLQGFTGLVWSHYYPVFDLRASYGSRKQEVKFNGSKVDDKWEEGIAEFGMSVPWRKISGRFNQNFTLRAFSKVIKVTSKYNRDITEINDGALFSPGAELRYSALSRMAHRDLLPKFGVSSFLHHEEGRDITGFNQSGSIQTAEGRLYLPGLFLHHSFYHQFAYERQRDDFYQYASYIFYPRGTRSVYLDELRKYSGNYSLPLFYPDWNWHRYFYLKRVSMNLFYDSINGKVRSFDYKASSTGWEVIVDTHFLRIFLPISWGVRGSYVIEGAERRNNYEVFLSSALGVF